MTPLKPPPASLLERYRGEHFLPLYTTTVAVTGGESGHGRASGVARSSDGRLEVTLRLPEELGGAGAGTNPEQLFAAAYGACFHGALHLLAARAGVALTDARVDVQVAFGRDPMDGLYMLTADVRIALPGVERELAEGLVRSAERLCPYTKMTRQGAAGSVSLV
ncbi:Ohr family peroxiredoxin [Massilia sp. ST3]|uniref:Ohr family peroxiredoxin n=1 Tax=Massilia sp. ST3 TaxID=2824903 RepID=UPI001B82677D|nr:Ohr family peroxiredoxin [Massilia sp. ST3]MBQ5950356.1 Ohr family peroxiredoxin [Massilia sp. ST3]